MAIRVYKRGNYLILLPDGQTDDIEFHASEVRISKDQNNRFYFRVGFDQIIEPLLESEIVDENDAGFKNVNYLGIIGVLIEAIKELNKKIDMK